MNNESNNNTGTDRVTLCLEDKASRAAKAHEIDDMTKATGDRAVYRYYFRRIGWVKATIFITFVIIEALCRTLSRKHYNYPRIWLQR